MSYTRQQIKDTVSYIVADAFSEQPRRVQRFLETSLNNIFNRLTSTGPSEIKFALDKNAPFLFTEFFEWLEQNNVPFPKNTRYVLKRDGQSVADHNGDLTLIVKKHKSSLKQHSDNYNDIIDALSEFHLDRDEAASTHQLNEETGYYGRAYNADGFDPEGYDENGYDKDGYDEDGYDKNGYDSDGYDEDGYDQDGYDCDGYDKNGDSKPNSEEPSSDQESSSDEYSSDEELDLDDSEYDAAREADEQKQRAALTFEHSNQSKSSRSLYFEAKKLAQIAKEEPQAKSKEERASLQPSDGTPTKRFANNPEKVMKTLPMLHGFSGFKEKCKQAHTAPRERVHHEAPVRKYAPNMA